MSNEAYTAACGYCGQVQIVYPPEGVFPDEEAVRRMAEMQCNCPGACAYQARQESLEKAKAEFGRLECADAVKDLLAMAAELCINEQIDGAAIKLDGAMKVGIGLNGKDKLVASFVRTDAIKQEF